MAITGLDLLVFGERRRKKGEKIFSVVRDPFDHFLSGFEESADRDWCAESGPLPTDPDELAAQISLFTEYMKTEHTRPFDHEGKMEPYGDRFYNCTSCCAAMHALPM